MSNRTEAAWRKLRHCHREATVTAPLLDSTQVSPHVFGGHCRRTTTATVDRAIVAYIMNFDVTILFPAALLTWLIVTILWSLISLHHRGSHFSK